MMFSHLGIFLCSFVLLHAEPDSCSRFHYEEQTLRKMIMVEILVDKLKADIAETKEKVHETLVEISDERIETVQTLEQVTSKVLEIENIVKDLKEKRDSKATEIIQFSARGIKNKSPVTKDTLIFQSVLSNNGSTYDKTTGIFTAPVGGLYMFSLQLCIKADTYLYFEIIATDNVILRGLGIDDTSKWATCHLYSVSVLLTAGNTVSVKAGRTNGGALWEGPENWNMLNGFLVQRN